MATLDDFTNVLVNGMDKALQDSINSKYNDTSTTQTQQTQMTKSIDGATTATGQPGVPAVKPGFLANMSTTEKTAIVVGALIAVAALFYLNK